MKDLKRMYVTNDIDMLVRSQVILNAFIQKKALFVASFPHLADPFADEFQVAIDEADALPFSDEVNGEISNIVEELKMKMVIAQRNLQILFNYVKVGWESKAKLNEFGKNKYQNARSSYSKMIDLLELAFITAEETNNKTVLLNIGYSQSQIDELNTLANEIDALLLQLNELKSNRYVLTEQRIKAYNTVWEFMKRVNKASKVVFVDNPAMTKTFLLYPTSKKKAKEVI